MGDALALTFSVCIALHTLCGTQKERAVRGSLERHIANRRMIVFSGIACLIGTLHGPLLILIGDYFMGIIFTLMGIGYGFAFKQACDDNDWFDRQRRRLKKGFQRIHAWRPRFPALAPTSPHA